MAVCVYVCVRVYECTCVYEGVCMRVCVCARMCVYEDVCMCMRVYVCVHRVINSVVLLPHKGKRGEEEGGGRLTDIGKFIKGIGEGF